MLPFGRLHTVAEAAAFCGLPLKYLREQLRRGAGPDYLLPSAKTKFFCEADLLKWMSTWQRRGEA